LIIFETKDDDVFICTYVKAGTTWVQQIVHLLLNNGEQGDLTYAESIPWLEAITSDLLNSREATGHSLESINNNQNRRFFKSHAIVRDLPRGHANIKVIVVVRNPKDTAVSLYHHARSKPEFGLTGSFNQFMELFLSGNVENGSWFDHALGWYEQYKLHPESHLFISYESLYQRPYDNILNIAKFLGINYDEELINKVVEGSSMESMKSNPKSNATWVQKKRR